MKRFCGQCGTELKADAMFCPECGAKVPEMEEELKKPESKIMEEDNGSQSEIAQSGNNLPEIESSEEPGESEKKKLNNRMKIAVVFVAAVLVFGVGYLGTTYFLNSSKKPTTTTGIRKVDKKKKKEGSDKIKDQCFEKELKGIGKITFESYSPDTSKSKNADAVFKIKKDKKAYETLPGMEKDNIRESKKFKSVKAVDFGEYTDDKLDDILVINTYTKKDSKEDEVRVYQQGSDKKFTIDKELTDVINKNVKDKTIENVKKYIESTKKNSDEWKQAYIDWVRQQGSDWQFDLFDLNGDDIPEIAAVGPTNPDGTTVATYADGQIQELHVWASSFIYEEGKNCIDDIYGHMGMNYDHVYTIKDGKWSQIANGEYGVKDDTNIQFDENDNMICDYYKWDYKDVDQKTYESNLAKVFNKADAKVLYEYGKEMTADEVIEKLQGENVELSTHSNYKAPEKSAKKSSNKSSNKSSGSIAADSSDVAGSADYNDVTMEDISSVTASSELSENGMTHIAGRVLDGDDSTAWVEGADGQGIGESLTFNFDGTYRVNGLTIKAGFQLDEETYYKNSRPKEITITFSDGSSETFTLDDEYGAEQYFEFDQLVNTSSVSITINSVYEGSKYEDTCITGVEFF